MDAFYQCVEGLHELQLLFTSLKACLDGYKTPTATLVRSDSYNIKSNVLL